MVVLIIIEVNVDIYELSQEHGKSSEKSLECLVCGISVF